MTIVVTDKVGLTNEASCKIKKDTTPPVTTELTIDPTDWTDDKTPTLSWIIESKLDLTSVEYKITSVDGLTTFVNWTPFRNDDDSTITDKVGSAAINCSEQGWNLDDRKYSIELRGVNSAGEGTDTKTVTYKLDTSNPYIPDPSATIRYIGEGEYQAVITWPVVADANMPDASGVAGYKIKLDNNNFVNIGNVRSHTFTDLSGVHTVFVVAYDNVGNESGLGIITLNHPQVIITAAADPVSGGSIHPFGSVNIDMGTNQSFTIIPNDGYEIDDVIVDKDTENEQHVKDDLTNIGNGTFTYTFESVEADHTIEVTFIATPVTPPTAPTVTVDPDTWTNTKPTVSWSGIEFGGSLEDVEYSLDGENWRSVGSAGKSGSFVLEDFEVLDDGEYTVYIRGVAGTNDDPMYGEDGEAQFFKDTTAPEGVENLEWYVNNAGDGDTAIVTTDLSVITDAHAGVAMVYYAITKTNTQPAEYEEIPDSFEYSKAVGMYIWVKAEDNAGNAVPMSFEMKEKPDNPDEKYTYFVDIKFNDRNVPIQIKGKVNGDVLYNYEIFKKNGEEWASFFKNDFKGNSGQIKEPSPSEYTPGDYYIIVKLINKKNDEIIGVNKQYFTVEGEYVQPVGENLLQFDYLGDWYADATLSEDYEVEKVFDGDISDDGRWAGEDGGLEQETVTMLFNDSYTFNQATINAWNQDDRIEEYELQYLIEDGDPRNEADWEYMTGGDGTELIDNTDVDIEFTRQTGDGIRLLITKSTPGLLATSVYEMEVMDNGEEDVTGVNEIDADVNLLDGDRRSSVEAGSEWTDDNPGIIGKKAVDSDMNTRWASTDAAVSEVNPVTLTAVFNDGYNFNHILLKQNIERIGSYSFEYLKFNTTDQWIQFAADA